jgi:hypothetical protein
VSSTEARYGVHRNVNERAYYEASELWRPEHFEREDERARFERCGELIPEHATTLLDVGAGQGSFLQLLELSRPTLGLHGLERSQAAIANAVSTTPIQLGSIEALPFADRSTDVVTALEVLEHLPYGAYEAGVRELTRVARDAIIVSVPYAERRRLMKCSYCGCRFHPHYHMRSFEPKTFACLFDGFMLDRCDVLSREDYLGGPILRWTWCRFHGGAYEMLPGSLCPQCGFRKQQLATRRAWARRGVRSWLPTKRRPGWLVGRFVRRP